MYINNWLRGFAGAVIASGAVLLYLGDFFWGWEVPYLEPQNTTDSNGEVGFSYIGAAGLFANAYLFSVNILFFMELNIPKRAKNAQKSADDFIDKVRTPLTIGLACAVLFTGLSAANSLFGVTVFFEM